MERALPLVKGPMWVPSMAEAEREPRMVPNLPGSVKNLRMTSTALP